MCRLPVIFACHLSYPLSSGARSLLFPKKLIPCGLGGAKLLGPSLLMMERQAGMERSKHHQEMEQRETEPRESSWLLDPAMPDPNTSGLHNYLRQ